MEARVGICILILLTLFDVVIQNLFGEFRWYRRRWLIFFYLKIEHISCWRLCRSCRWLWRHDIVSNSPLLNWRFTALQILHQCFILRIFRVDGQNLYSWGISYLVSWTLSLSMILMMKLGTLCDELLPPSALHLWLVELLINKMHALSLSTETFGVLSLILDYVHLCRWTHSIRFVT